MQPTVIVIEGNIGTGKSTLLPKLAERLGFTQLQEPVDDPKFLELLKEFTENPNDSTKRIRFQQYITKRRSEMLKGLPADAKVIIERSLFSDLVFCQTNMLATERPDGAYLSYYYDIKDRLKDYPQVSCLVYLKSNPYKSYTRMLERGRKEEQGTPYEYISDLENFHLACLPQICRQYKTPYVEIDWSDFGCVDDVAKKIEYVLAYKTQQATW